MKNVLNVTLRQATLAIAALLCVATIQVARIVASQPPKAATAVPPAQAALAIPKPAEATDRPYTPQPNCRGASSSRSTRPILPLSRRNEFAKPRSTT